MKKEFATLILVSSNSVHARRYLNGVLPYFKQVLFVTNNSVDLELSANLVIKTFNFKLVNFKLKKQLATLINQYPEAIIHVHQANSYAYHTFKSLELVKNKHKILLTTWGSDVLVLPYKNIFFKRMVQFNLAAADIVTSDSLFMSSEIKKLCPQVKDLYTINFGMKNFPGSLDLTQKENIIFSNRLHKKLYNVDKIITAFHEFIQNNLLYVDFKLVIAANGDETENLTKLVMQYGIENQVIFSGMLGADELKKLYLKAKIFISIPSSDATSLSVLEAMGYGCYPILSNLPANLEWVIDGINGSICENNDCLMNTMENAFKIIANKEEFCKIANFNYQLIKQKAVFEDNLQKFLQLYS